MVISKRETKGNNAWDFLINLTDDFFQTIIIVLCTPVGWVGIIIIGFVYMWITGALPA